MPIQGRLEVFIGMSQWSPTRMSRLKPQAGAVLASRVDIQTRKERIVVILEARLVRLQQQPGEVQQLKNKFCLHLHEISDPRHTRTTRVQAGNATSVGPDAMHCNC